LLVAGAGRAEEIDYEEGFFPARCVIERDVVQRRLVASPNGPGRDLQRKVHIEDRNATVDGMYLRIIVHANEHMGQLVAYARMTGVAPPWAN
jgi:hypothetical protein